MLGFMRRRPRDDPADHALPDRMHDAQPRTVLAIDGGHRAIDCMTYARQKFCLEILKSRNIHWSALRSLRATASETICTTTMAILAHRTVRDNPAAHHWMEEAEEAAV